MGCDNSLQDHPKFIKGLPYKAYILLFLYSYIQTYIFADAIHECFKVNFLILNICQ